ncbi:MAG: ABC transporter permease [Phycisphaerales bacterium]|nr:ABC transporter permease [Phycisphaerales bacterium]
MITQTIALFVDAYRELNAKKLFWITMLLSGLVVLVYAAVGINEKGIFFLWFKIPTPVPIDSTTLPPALLYKQLFQALGIKIWLTWAATILALISTAGIIPEMISGGSIEMLLSKPISRTRLLLTKYATGLMFATLQVAAFTTASFIIIGVRGHVWEPGLFLAVPLVVVFFSYLYGVCALIGVLTRSTIAALLLTILCWCGLFILNTGDAVLMGINVQLQARHDGYDRAISKSRDGARKLLTARRAESGDPLPDDHALSDEELLEVMPFLSLAFDRRAETEQSLAKLKPWMKAVYAAKTIVPKTSETTSLLERWLVSMADLKAQARANPERADSGLDTKTGEINLDDQEVKLRAEEAIRARPVWWILGTSLAFEAVMLSAACVVFARRDN